MFKVLSARYGCCSKWPPRLTAIVVHDRIFWGISLHSLGLSNPKSSLYRYPNLGFEISIDIIQIVCVCTVYIIYIYVTCMYTYMCITSYYIQNLRSQGYLILIDILMFQTTNQTTWPFNLLATSWQNISLTKNIPLAPKSLRRSE